MAEEKELHSGKSGTDVGEPSKEDLKAAQPPTSGGAKPSLPPITSARPVGGGAKQNVPSPISSKPAVSSSRVAQPARTSPDAARPPQTDAPSLEKKPASPATAEPKGAFPVGTVPRGATAAPATRPTAQKIVKPKQDKAPENDQGIWRISRKNFLNVAGWFAFFSFLVTATIGAIRLMVPRVLYEPPSAFKAGFPEDYIIGEVNEAYKDEHRVWIVRERDGFYALAAICTHLGCTPRWAPIENKFKCPCHGSGYHKDGVNFEGPTPRPLERLKITLADDGQILVDRNIKFLYEKGEWTKADAYLKFG